jgi:hypothetical protein
MVSSMDYVQEQCIEQVAVLRAFMADFERALPKLETWNLAGVEDIFEKNEEVEVRMRAVVAARQELVEVVLPAVESVTCLATEERTLQAALGQWRELAGEIKALQRPVALLVSSLVAADIFVNAGKYEDPEAAARGVLKFMGGLGITRMDLHGRLRSKMLAVVSEKGNARGEKGWQERQEGGEAGPGRVVARAAGAAGQERRGGRREARAAAAAASSSKERPGQPGADAAVARAGQRQKKGAAAAAAAGALPAAVPRGSLPEKPELPRPKKQKKGDKPGA